MVNPSESSNSSREPSDEGAKECFEDLIANHQKQIYCFIRSMVFNPEDARDILQDVNVVVWRKQERYEMETNFKAWAFSIARFECLNYLTRYKKENRSTLDTGLLETIAAEVDEKSDGLESCIRLLNGCLSDLTEENRFIIKSRYEDRIALERTAEELETSVGAIKQKLFRARKALRDCIMNKQRDER